MIQSRQSKRGTLLSRTALGIALALGVAVGGTVVPTAAHAQKKPKMEFSKGFVQVAAPLQKALEEAKERGAVKSAKAKLDAAIQQNNASAADAARAELNSALSNEKSQLDQAFSAVENEDDRYLAGSLAVNLGSLANDPGVQRRGLEAMLASGRADPADVPRFQSIVGQLAYQAKDYATAEKYLQQAVSAGYYENNTEAILAEAYISSNKPTQGLNVLKKAIERREATGSAAPEGWYRRGLGAAYSAKSIPLATEFGASLAKAYPTTANWGGAVTILRELGNYGSQEALDLLRLMGRTNSYAEERDYVEYIQAADPRRLPGEVMEIIDAGVKAGKLNASETFIADARKEASGRVSSDKASLSGYERDASAASANLATITGAADALLSYDQPAKAEEFYKKALNKPGAETERVLTRIGIAQVDQGKFAEAKETFAKVTGNRAPIAKLWMAYAEHKSNGSASSSATASTEQAPASAEQ